MSLHNMNSLSQTMNQLKENGVRHEFMVRNKKLIDQQNNNTYAPNEVAIKKEFRFEGESNPGDSSILYVLETKGGEKGLLINTYTAKEDESVSQFIKEAEWEKSKKL